MAKKTDYSKILRGGDNIPTDKEKWAASVAAAKAKFKVYPSAVANAWASRHYADKGGTWKGADGGEVTLTPADMTLARRAYHDQPLGTSLEQAAPRPNTPKVEKPKAPPKEKEKEKKKDEGTDKPTMAGVNATPEELLAGGGSSEEPPPRDLEAEFRDLAEGKAEGGLIGSMSALTTAIGKQMESPFPEVQQIGFPENIPSAKVKQPESLAEGGLVVTRTSERKGKTHKVVDKKTGETHYFGDPDLGQHPKDPARKAAFYARHKSNLAGNRFFRAYARATWADGGLIQHFQDGGMGAVDPDFPLPEFSPEAEAAARQEEEEAKKAKAAKEAAEKAAAPAAAPALPDIPPPPPLEETPPIPVPPKPVETPKSAKGEEKKPAPALAQQVKADLKKAEDQKEAVATLGDAGKEPEPTLGKRLNSKDLAGRLIGGEYGLSRKEGIKGLDRPFFGLSADSKIMGLRDATNQYELQQVITNARTWFPDLETEDRALIIKEYNEARKRLPTSESLAEKLKSSVEKLRNVPADQFQEGKKKLVQASMRLAPQDQTAIGSLLSEISDARGGAAELTKPQEPKPFREARGPLAAVIEAGRDKEKYGDRYAEFLDLERRAFAELGGEIPLTGKETEAQKTSILERNRFRREAAKNVARDMLAGSSPVRPPTTETGKVSQQTNVEPTGMRLPAPRTPADGMAPTTPPAPTTDKATTTPAGASAGTTPAPTTGEASAAPITAPSALPAGVPAAPAPTGLPATTPSAGALTIEGDLQRQIDEREVEMKRLADLAKGSKAGTAAGIAGVLGGLKKPDGTAYDLNNPVDRYSKSVMDVIRATGDFSLVKQALVAAGYNDKIKDKNTLTTEADRIAADEVLRGTRSGAAPEKMPTGIEAMEIARQSPEYQAAARAAQTGAEIAMEKAKITAKEAELTDTIRKAQIDLEVKLARDFQLKKLALDEQTREMRRQINNQTIQPKRLFVMGENFAMSSVLAALDIVGSGLGSKASIMDYVQGRINDDLQQQIGLLNTRRTLLGDLVKQGNDIEDAYKLSDAFYKKVFAMELERGVGNLKSDRARLEGFSAAQKLLADAAKAEEEILKKQTDTIREFYANKINTAATGVKNAAEYARIAAGVRAAGIRAEGARAKEKQRLIDEDWKRNGPAGSLPFLEGGSINTGDYANLVKWASSTGKGDLAKSGVPKYEEVTITETLPNGVKYQYTTLQPVQGQVQMAYPDGTSSKEVKDIDDDARKFLGYLNELELIAARNNFTGFAGWANPAEKARAQKVEGDLAAALGGKLNYNVGVPQEAEYQRLKDAIPKATEYSTAGYSRAKFDQFRKDLLRNMRNIRDERLVGGFAASRTPAAGATPPAPRTK